MQEIPKMDLESKEILRKHFVKAYEFLNDAAIELASFLDQELLSSGKKPYDLIPPYQRKATLKGKKSFSDIGLLTLLKTYKFNFIEGADDKRLQYIHKKIIDARNYIKSHEKGVEFDELFTHLVGIKLFVQHINQESLLINQISEAQKELLDDMFGSEKKKLIEIIKDHETKIKDGEVTIKEKECLIKNKSEELQELKNKLKTNDELLISLKDEIRKTGNLGEKNSKRIIFSVVISFCVLICVMTATSIILKKSFEKTIPSVSSDKEIAEQMKQSEKAKPEEIIKRKYKNPLKGD